MHCAVGTAYEHQFAPRTHESAFEHNAHSWFTCTSNFGKVRISGGTDFQIYGFAEVRISMGTGFRRYGFPGARISGGMDFRMYGFPDVWISGGTDFRR